MRLALFATLIFSLIVPGMAKAQTPDSTPEPHPSCADLDEYFDDILSKTFLSLPESDQDLIREFAEEDIDPTEERPSKLRRASEAFDEWASLLDDVDEADIPYAARQYHEVVVDNLSIIASVLNAVAATGPIAIFGYAEQAEELPSRWERVEEDGKRLCGNAWDILGGSFVLPPEE